MLERGRGTGTAATLEEVLQMKHCIDWYLVTLAARHFQNDPNIKLTIPPDEQSPQREETSYQCSVRVSDPIALGIIICECYHLCQWCWIPGGATRKSSIDQSHKYGLVGEN
jgi:hypothetical protein